MKNTQLNSVIRLVRRTGDRVVIMDNESEEVMVLMNMNNYESLLDNNQNIEKMTEEQLLEKINRDIAVWRAYNEGEEKFFEGSEKEDAKPLDEFELKQEISEGSKPENAPKIIEKSATDAISVENEEALGNISEEEGEEKFYLEPVE